MCEWPEPQTFFRSEDVETFSLVVLVVLGILSGIAIARFVSIKEAAYIASMKADLRNFALYEQNYLMDSQGSYFAGNGAAQGFVRTEGVTITATIDPGPPPSWHAIATHDKTAKTCSIVTDGPFDLGHRLSLELDP